MSGRNAKASAIGQRLKAARTLRGLDAAEMGRIGGVSRTVQYSYEKGDTLPDAAYLARIAAHGADVLHIITGAEVSCTASFRAGTAPWVSQRPSQAKPHYRLHVDGVLNLVERRPS